VSVAARSPDDANPVLLGTPAARARFERRAWRLAVLLVLLAGCAVLQHIPPTSVCLELQGDGGVDLVTKGPAGAGEFEFARQRWSPPRANP
jgi:hypothetical protein